MAGRYDRRKVLEAPRRKKKVGAGDSLAPKRDGDGANGGVLPAARTPVLPVPAVPAAQGYGVTALVSEGCRGVIHDLDAAGLCDCGLLFPGFGA